MKLSETERREFLAEARSVSRREEFAAVKRLGASRPAMTADEYIVFVSTFNAFINHAPKICQPIREGRFMP